MDVAQRLTVGVARDETVRRHLGSPRRRGFRPLRRIPVSDQLRPNWVVSHHKLLSGLTSLAPKRTIAALGDVCFWKQSGRRSTPSHHSRRVQYAVLGLVTSFRGAITAHPHFTDDI